MKAILLVVFTILNFIVYHKIFRVTYFGSMRKSIANELIWCLLGACVEVAIIIMVGQLIGRIVFFAGLAALIIFWLVLVYKYWNKIKKSKIAKNNVNQNEEIIRENLSEGNEEVKAESFIDRCATLSNIFWIGCLWLLLVLLLSGAASPSEKENEEVESNDNYVEQYHETDPADNEDSEEYQEIEEDYVEELEESETESLGVENTVQDVDYASIYGEVVIEVQMDVSERGGYLEDLTYVLFDMDKDGYKELLIENSTSSADAIYEVYKTDGNTVTMLGSILGNCDFYEAGNGFGYGGIGIFADYCHAGHEYINYIYPYEYSIIEQTVFEQETEEYGYYEGERIEELKIPIEIKYVSDFENAM